MKMKKIIKSLSITVLCCGFFVLNFTSINATKDTGSFYQDSYYGVLYCSNNFEKLAGSPDGKRADLDVSIGRNVAYIGVSIEVYNYYTGDFYTSISPLAGKNASSHHRDFEFLNVDGGSSAKIFNNYCTAFGTHEYRDTDSGVAYTETYC